jgi:radical SAM superfamily enzyme YgiQ (UPF0313 family)
MTRPVVLIYPRTEPNINPPLGLLYLATHLEQHNITVKVIDFTFHGFKDGLRRLDPYLYDSLLFGISSETLLIPKALRIAKYIKQQNKDAKILLGGCHVTAVPNTLEDPNLDYIINGEGEFTLLELVNSLINGKDYSNIEGIGYKRNGKVQINPKRELIQDLDSIPFPNRDLVDIRRYMRNAPGRASWSLPEPVATMVTSRGCPFQCTFCSSHLTFGRKVRRRSVDNVTDEIKFLQSKYGIKGILFHDDTFTVLKDWVIRFCDNILAEKIKFNWFCNGRINVIDEDMLIKMKKAGCVGLSYGVESGNQYVLNNIIKKGITLKQIEKVFRMTKKHGLISHGTFMFGNPGETLAQMKDTIKFAKRINPDVVHFSIAIPFPNTEMERMAKEYGKIIKANWETFDFSNNGVIFTKDFSPKDVIRIKKKAHRQFYFRPQFILNKLSRIRTFSDFKKLMNGFKMLINRV